MPNPNIEINWGTESTSSSSSSNWVTVNVDSSGNIVSSNADFPDYSYMYSPVWGEVSVVERYKKKKVRECGLSLFLKRIDKNEIK